MLWLFPIALLAVCALIVIFILLTAIYDHVKLSRRTGGMSRSEFVESLAEEGVPTVLGDAIYDYYRKLTGVKTFRVHPDDDLGEIYHSYAEEVEEAIDDIARALDLELKDLSVLRRRRTPVLTVRDLAKWLNWARKKGAQEQERPQDLALEDDSWVPSLWPYG